MIARGEKRALEVDVDYRVPIGRGCREEVDAREDAGVVDHDVNPAEAIGGADHAADVGLFSDAALDHRGAAAGRLDAPDDHLGGGAAVEVVDDHCRALARKGHRDRRADALLCPGHHRDPVCQSHGASRLRLVGLADGRRLGRGLTRKRPANMTASAAQTQALCRSAKIAMPHKTPEAVTR